MAEVHAHERWRASIVAAGLAALALAVFLPGINWGLPSRRVDPFLFGDHPVWTGEQIAKLAGERDLNLRIGADVDVNPLSRDRARPIVLNATDEQRAQIIRRYRLYSYQPDEMITFMALSTIARTGGDPRLYQYGGLWMYPVGALVKVLEDPKSSQAYYLDHPEEFGRFYVIARGYVVAWALVGVWAVFWIARRLGADLPIAAAATVCFIFLPVVVNMAHEAKPHLPGAVLILLAIIAATKYVEIGRARWWILAGCLSGGAFGMVISALVAFLILPVMTVLRAQSWSRRFAITLMSVVCGLVVFAMTNPFVIIHLFHDREILQSNLQNSREMYSAAPSVPGVLNACYLIGLGATPLLAGLGGIFASVRARQARKPAGWLLGTVGLAVVLQFAFFASEKPAEYARFALLADIALGIAAVVGLRLLLKHRRPHIAAATVLCATTAACGVPYVVQFVRDSTSCSTRLLLAARISELDTHRTTDLWLQAEPAPYSLPPVNLFRWNLILGEAPVGAAGLSVRPIDTPPAPISWAGKSFAVKRNEK